MERGEIILPPLFCGKFFLSMEGAPACGLRLSGARPPRVARPFACARRGPWALGACGVSRRSVARWPRSGPGVGSPAPLPSEKKKNIKNYHLLPYIEALNIENYYIW